MAGKPVGTMFAEFELDLTPMERKLKTAHTKTVEGTQKFEQTFKQLGVKSDRMFDAQKKQAIASYDAIARHSKSTGNDILRAEKAKNAQLSRLNRQQFGEQNSLLKTLKKNWMGVSAAIIAGFYAIRRAVVLIKPFAEFESALLDMTRVTDQSMKAINKQMGALDSRLGSLTSLTQGYYQVMSAGVTETTKALDLLEVASKTAKIAHIDQATAVKSIAVMMDAYSDEIKKASDAADLFLTIEQKGITTTGELAQQIGQVANLAEIMGLSVDELGASLAQLTKSGIGTSESITQLRSFLTALNKKFNDLPESIKKYGSATAAIQALGFQGTLQEILDATGGNSVELTNLLGKQEAFSALLQLSKKEFKGYIDALGAMEEKTGKLDKSWVLYNETLNASYDRMKNLVNKELTKFGETIAPLVINAMNAISNELDGVNQGFTAFDKIVSTSPHLKAIFESPSLLAEGMMDIAYAWGFWADVINKLNETGADLFGGPAGMPPSLILATTTSMEELVRLAKELEEQNKKTTDSTEEWTDGLQDLKVGLDEAAGSIEHHNKILQDFYDNPENTLITQDEWDAYLRDYVGQFEESNEDIKDITKDTALVMENEWERAIMSMADIFASLVMSVASGAGDISNIFRNLGFSMGENILSSVFGGIMGGGSGGGGFGIPGLGSLGGLLGSGTPSYMIPIVDALSGIPVLGSDLFATAFLSNPLTLPLMLAAGGYMFGQSRHNRHDYRRERRGQYVFGEMAGMHGEAMAGDWGGMIDVATSYPLYFGGRGAEWGPYGTSQLTPFMRENRPGGGAYPGWEAGVKFQDDWYDETRLQDTMPEEDYWRTIAYWDDITISALNSLDAQKKATGATAQALGEYREQMELTEELMGGWGDEAYDTAQMMLEQYDAMVLMTASDLWEKFEDGRISIEAFNQALDDMGLTSMEQETILLTSSLDSLLTSVDIGSEKFWEIVQIMRDAETAIMEVTFAEQQMIDIQNALLTNLDLTEDEIITLVTYYQLLQDVIDGNIDSMADFVDMGELVRDILYGVGDAADEAARAIGNLNTRMKESERARGAHVGSGGLHADDLTAFRILLRGGTADEARMAVIGDRYGSDLTSQSVRATIEAILGMSSTQLERFAAIHNVTTEQLMDDTLWLAEQFGIIGGAAGDAADSINDLVSRMNAWQNVVDALGNQILGYQTSLANPADAIERLGIARQAITDYMGGMDLSTFMSGLGSDEARIEAVQHLADLWNTYLGVGQEAHQRPSIEYQQIFEEVIGSLGMLQEYSALQVSEYEIQLQQLGWLEQIAINTGGGAGAGTGNGAGNGAGAGGIGGGGFFGEIPLGGNPTDTGLTGTGEGHWEWQTTASGSGFWTWVRDSKSSTGGGDVAPQTNIFQITGDNADDIADKVYRILETPTAKSITRRTVGGKG